MFDNNQSCIIETRAQPSDESGRVRENGTSIRRKREQIMETPQELMALISYLRQQEAGVLDAMRQLRDAS